MTLITIQIFGWIGLGAIAAAIIILGAAALRKARNDICDARIPFERWTRFIGPKGRAG